MNEDQSVIPTANKTLTTGFGRIPATAEFIERNKLTHQRTSQEILAYLALPQANDLFGFTREVLVPFLPLDSAVEFLSEEGRQAWKPSDAGLQEIAQDVLDYLLFAWDKALDERGISSERSIFKLPAWMWLLGREDIQVVLLDNDLYNPYGAPALIRASEMLGIDVPDELREFAKRKV